MMLSLTREGRVRGLGATMREQVRVGNRPDQLLL
jgi:hypothetical protein